jgi:hypothetical protein
MTDEDVVARVAAMLGTGYFTRDGRHKSLLNIKPVRRTTLVGKRAAALLREIRPFMGERRRAKIDDVLVGGHYPA